MKYVIWVLEFWGESFRIFLDTFSSGVFSRAYFPRMLPRSINGDVLVYDLLMSGNEDEWMVLGTLHQALPVFFSRNRISLRISDEKTISLCVEGYPGACAVINLSKQLWTLSVPSNLLAGPSYEESESKWDDIAMKISQALSEKYAY